MATNIETNLIMEANTESYINPIYKNLFFKKKEKKILMLET